MNFSEILYELKKGKCVRRSGWNGKGMYIYVVNSQSSFNIDWDHIL